MKEELHLAKNLQELNKIAQLPKDLFKKNVTNKNAEKLFKTGFAKLRKGDEESAFIFFARFLLVYDALAKTKGEEYAGKILGTEHKTVTESLSELQASLTIRYAELKLKEPCGQVIEEPKPIIAATITITFPSGYITCEELYNVIQNEYDIVLLDARPAKDFEQSAMKHSSCVNIPENIIQNGLSANKLSKSIPSTSLQQWERRWKCCVLILLDWSSTKENLSTSKLNILRDILLNWDTDVVDNSVPVILSGGYLEFLHLYPSYCTNPATVYQVQNTVLNELLDLDIIEYPPTEDTTPARFLKPSLPEQPTVNRATKPVFTDENVASLQKNLLNEEKEIEIKFYQYEQNLVDLRNKHQLEAEEGMKKALQLREEKLLKDMAALAKRQHELNDENEVLRKQLKMYGSKKGKDNGSSTEDASSDDKNRRDRLLSEARAEKKKLAPETKKTTTGAKKTKQNKLPKVDRKSKPSVKTLVEPGTSGLKNFGTTCYMNTVLQCLAHTNAIKTYFRNDFLDDSNDRQYGELVLCFAEVIQELWTGNYKVFFPKDFLVSASCIGDCAPRYRGREHQDAHEFLVAITQWIHDDMKTDIYRPIQPCWTPKVASWVEQTDGKTSIILSTFCGQIKYIISCDTCDKRKDKYEIFEHLPLSIPAGDFVTLKDCLDGFFNKQAIIGYTCPKCSSNKKVFQQASLAAHPPVLIMLLKRFVECFDTGYLTYKKNPVVVDYPLEVKFGTTKYNLYAVVNHRGTLQHGHYISFCKNSESNKWYRFDDEKVVEIDHVAAVHGKDAYMLFYQKEEQVKTTTSSESDKTACDKK